MNNPIEVLLSEHHVIQKAVRQVPQLEGTWNEDQDVYSRNIQNLITFFKEYADEYHHKKEEDILFPALNEHPEFILDSILDEFVRHHDDFRIYTSEILEALEDKEFEKSYKILKRYCSELEDHIAAENDELFVLAENLLSPEQLERIYFNFEDIDLQNGKVRKTEIEDSIS